VADHFQALFTSILGFQYIFKSSWQNKSRNWCYYYICNLSDASRDGHQSANDPSRKQKRFTNPKKCYLCSGSLTITVNPECAEEQPAVTLKYQHKHLHQAPINHRVAPEIIDFIGEHKTSAPSIIEELLHKDKRFDGKLDNVTSQQIYNYWLSSTSHQWKLDPAEFTSSKMHIAVSEGWESLGMDIEDVSMAFTTPFFRDPAMNVGNGKYILNELNNYVC